MDTFQSEIELDSNPDFLIIAWVTVGRVLNVSELRVGTFVKWG